MMAEEALIMLEICLLPELPMITTEIPECSRVIDVVYDGTASLSVGPVVHNHGLVSKIRLSLGS